MNRNTLILLVLALLAGCHAPRRHAGRYEYPYVTKEFPDGDLGNYSTFVDVCLHKWNQSARQCENFWFDYAYGKDDREGRQKKYEIKKLAQEKGDPIVKMPDRKFGIGGRTLSGREVYIKWTPEAVQACCPEELNPWTDGASSHPQEDMIDMMDSVDVYRPSKY